MGFWSSLGNAAKAGMKAVNDLNQETRDLKEKFSYKSDDELIGIAKRGSMAEKMAASSILRSRGYGKEVSE